MPKVALSIHDQVAKLSANGLLDADSKLTSGLMTHGYFRLSGYWRFFQVDPSAGNNIFHHGTDFSKVLGIYLLDAELRNLLLEGLAEVEIALRSSLVANLCAPGGHGNEYLDPETYTSSKNSDGVAKRFGCTDGLTRHCLTGHEHEAAKVAAPRGSWAKIYAQIDTQKHVHKTDPRRILLA